MDDLLSEFLTETNESLAVLDLELVKLEQNPNDPALLGSIFRIVHTIKGTCGFLGLPRLEALAHASENVLGKIREGELPVTAQAVSVVLESLDAIKLLLAALEEHGSEPDGDDRTLIARLELLAGGVEEAPVPISRPVREIVPETPRTEVTPPSAAPAEAIEAKESAIAAQRIRVNVDLLENLMTMVGELVLTRNQLMQIMRSQKESEFTVPLQRLSHVTTELQEGVMKTRMQPIGNAWAKLPRIVRDLSHELDKKIDLRMFGAETELDRQVLELINDPLTHMVRNSADHGIELPSDRVSAGKHEAGIITLNAYHEGGHIIIEISDDGRGLDIEKIKQKAVAMGLASESDLATMPEQQIQQFIFKAGFSTATSVTSVSGRGVGMDVVRTNIEKIGGTVEMKSVQGRGSTFIIKIPLTLAIISALVVQCANERFAIPQISVIELVRAAAGGENRIEWLNNAPVFRLRNQLLPLVSLRELFRLGERSDQQREAYIVVTQVGTYTFGMIVDRVFDTEEIVVKPVAPILRDITLFSGNTILGDGSVIMILDPNGIAAATGEITVADSGMRNEQVAQQTNGIEGDVTSLLLFRAGTGAPKAVPLSLIARLEEVDLAQVEYANDRPVVQYRGKLMPLVAIDENHQLRTEGRQPLLVFAEKEHAMGLIVDEIIDIVEDHLAIELAVERPGFIGSAVIAGKSTDLIDASFYLRQVYADWFTSPEDEAQGKGKNKRILLVDDSPFFRNLLKPLLSVAGYEVTTADSGDRALGLCEAGVDFDVIISDIEMPGMNGFEFASTVKNASRWKNIPMVALSSHATPSDLDRGRAAGFNDYVAKLDRGALLQTLSEALNNVRGAA